MPTPSRAVRLLAAIASVVFTFALAAIVELAAGFLVTADHPREIRGDAVSQTMTWLDINPAPQVRDVDLLWRNAPGARKTQAVNPRAFGRNDQWSLAINSQGFRGPELVEPAADEADEKVFRILCVGDSITFGFGVDQDDTYPQQLSDLLTRRYPDRSFEVVNAGVPGWTWLQGLRFLDLSGGQLDPDLIIIGHGSNDQFFAAKITDEELFLRLSGPLERLAHRLSNFAAETNVYRALRRGSPQQVEVTESPGCKVQKLTSAGCHRVSVEQIATAVHEVRQVAAGLGSDLLVANTDFLETPAVRGVRAGVDKDGVSFVDLVEELNRRQRTDEEDRARRLGLAQASAPAVAEPGAEPVSRRAVLRVLVPDPKHEYHVWGTGPYRPDFSFAEPMHDDGTHGDERAGDGVFTATIEVPAEFAAVVYRFATGETFEFTPLPPLASSLGDRVLPTTGDVVGPVDVFGQALYMVERTHPNRDGHRLIAQLIAAKLDELPRFREHVQGARRVDVPAAESGG